MDIWFERCNNSSQGWNKKRKAFLSLSWSFKDGKNLFPGKQKISPREKKTSVGSEEQRRWNSCAFSFFFPNIITSVSQLRNRTWSDKLRFLPVNSAQLLTWGWMSSTGSSDNGRRRERANVNYLCESLLPSQFMVSAKSDVLSLWNIIAVCCESLLASAMELEHCQKFPPAQIALASFFVTCVSAPSKKNDLRGEKPAWACAENFYLLTCKSFSQVFLSKWAACIPHCTWIRLVGQLHQQDSKQTTQKTGQTTRCGPNALMPLQWSAAIGTESSLLCKMSHSAMKFNLLVGRVSCFLHRH